MRKLSYIAIGGMTICGLVIAADRWVGKALERAWS